MLIYAINPNKKKTLLFLGKFSKKMARFSKQFFKNKYYFISCWAK